MPTAPYIEQTDCKLEVEAKVLCYRVPHVDAGSSGAKDTHLETPRVHQAHRRRSEWYHNVMLTYSFGISDCELTPRLVHSSVEKPQFKVGFYGDVFGEVLRIASWRLDEHILAIKPQALIRDLCRFDLQWTQAFDWIYEELLDTPSRQLCCSALAGYAHGRADLQWS